MSHAATIKAFDKDAADYDALRRKLIPCYDLFYGTVITLIEEHGLAPDARILDLGAGTGLLSEHVLRRWPQAHIHLLDGSNEMLKQARDRFAGNPRLSFQCAEFSTADLAGPWDVIVSAVAIHHLYDDEKKLLYRRIFDALKQGGLFINAEQVQGPTPAIHALYEKMWRDQAQSLGATPADLEAAALRMATDRCAPIEDQIAWLREAGFAEADCLFKAWRFAVMAGWRRTKGPASTKPSS
ncbi:class I SAM-dependent methyltransferase [Methyloferula stellata]|uniref:class I SAM-dependent methyltransferase n=1 Tax=Methyloferula stellata TaxID=876270 RepID=UPI00037FE900|nr:class I SAM-dependent methyltransferase [Methyloferula stellata]